MKKIMMSKAINDKKNEGTIGEKFMELSVYKKSHQEFVQYLERKFHCT